VSDFQRRFPSDGRPADIARTLLLLGFNAARLNFLTAFSARSVPTHAPQITAGNLTLPLPQARQNLGRLAN
jgi:hypothetical protein